MITPVSSTEQPKFNEFMKTANEKIAKQDATNKVAVSNELEKQETAKVVETNTKAVNALFYGAQGNKIRFENIDKETVIKIMDENDELVRQIPPEELMNMKSKMDDLKGQFLDTYV